MRILLVEDGKNWCRAFKNTFRKPQYILKITDDIDEAENLIRQMDIAIVNISLIQGMDWDESGKVFLAYIQDNYAHIPRIAISGKGGYSVREITEEFIKELGVYDVLIKPFRIDKLINEMNNAVNESSNDDATANSSIMPKKRGLIEMNDEFQKIKVFISYASEDYNIAKRLYGDLEREGLEPWLDRENLLAGQDWKAIIPRIIKDSSYFLLLISGNSVSKIGYIQKEQKIALDVLDEFPSDKIFIIPARIDNTEPIHEKLRNLHWADLSDYKQGLEQILKTLKAGRPNLIEEEKQGLKKKSDKGDNMIIELLTKATAGAGMKFLFDRLGALTDRLNDEQLAKMKEIEEKAKSAETEQDVVTVQTELKEILPADAEIDSIDAFVSWVEEKVDTSFNDMVGVSELIVQLLRKIRRVEKNSMRKNDLLEMEAALKTEIEGFERKLKIGDADSQSKKDLYIRMNKAFDFIKE